MGYVDVYETEETGEQRLLCRLTYSGGSIHITGSRTVGRLILERELNEERPLNWQNGERFLMALHRHYTGTRLRVSEYLKGSKNQINEEQIKKDQTLRSSLPEHS